MVRGKYQNKEKPLKRQRILGIIDRYVRAYVRRWMDACSYVSIHARKLSYVICAQQRVSSSCASTRSDQSCFTITKTCLYNFDPLKLHFYIVKLGFTEVYIIFLIFLFLLKNIDCEYSLEPPRRGRGGSNEYPQSTFLSRNIKKYQRFLFENFQIFGGEIFYLFE